MMDFIVLGLIPGTNTQLDLFEIIIAAMAVYVLILTVRKHRHSLNKKINDLVAETHIDSVASVNQ